MNTSSAFDRYHTISESEFNKLSPKDRLDYLHSKFMAGMQVCVKITTSISEFRPVPPQYGTVCGFYDERTPPGNISSSKNYSLKRTQAETIPQCNVYVLIDGKVSGFYPLWISPDYMKIRDDKMKSIGIYCV
jgi:hypothetical protein